MISDTPNSQQPARMSLENSKTETQERKAKIKALIDNNHHACLLVLCFVVVGFFFLFVFLTAVHKAKYSFKYFFSSFILYHTDTDTCTSILPFLVHLLTPSLSNSSILFN